MGGDGVAGFPRTAADQRYRGARSAVALTVSVILAGASPAAAAPAPDLVTVSTTNPPATLRAGRGFKVTDKVQNNGGAAAASATRYYLSKDKRKGRTDRRLGGIRRVSKLARLRTSRGTVTVKVAATTPPAIYYLLACADDLRKVRESREGNNCRASVRRIRVLPPLPDLVTTEVTSPPATLRAGASFAITDTVKNQGLGPAGGSVSRYYLSADGLRNSGDTLMSGKRAVLGRRPGESSRGTTTVTLPASAAGKTLFVLACADDLKAVAEAREANNCRASGTAIRVTAPPVNQQTPKEINETPPPAPDITGSEMVSFYEATRFLYTGTNPVQTGVDAATIDQLRVAALRGRVSTDAGAPLAGVAVSILDHPEYGQTLTRADGMFDLVINAGTYVVNFDKSGSMPLQQDVTAPQQQYTWTSPATMLPYDTKVTAVSQDGTAVQAARGTKVADESGARTATLLFDPNTDATMTVGGNEVPISGNLNVRATEYTVGDNGPASMPGDLPGLSAYTYAVEYSVDQAVAAGATNVEFTKPVATYVENFLDFPVGDPVPAGYYDREKGDWVAGEDGRIIKIVSEASSRANLDVTGDGAVDSGTTLTNLGITDAERVKLAALYNAPTELWRVEVSHFTPWDYNWPYTPPDGAVPPSVKDPSEDDPETDCEGSQAGSIIGCLDQSLGEEIPITGTPLSLRYQSNRTSGYTGGQFLNIPLTEPTLPPQLLRVELKIDVAGRHFEASYPATPNLRYEFKWDGKDAYGRELNGVQTARVTIGYVYPAVYRASSEEFAVGFGQPGGTAYDTNRTRQEITLTQQLQTPVSKYVAGKQGLGGWSLDKHHVYDPMARTLLLGDGSRQSSEGRTVSGVVTRVAGDDFTPSRWVGRPVGLDYGPGGDLYIASDHWYAQVYKQTPAGAVTAIAGMANDDGYSGDGGPALQARLSSQIEDIAAAPDGTFYIADTGNNVIRRVDPNGIITTFAGQKGIYPPEDSPGGVGDGGQAAAAVLDNPEALEVGPDGYVYIGEGCCGTGRVRRVAPDGVITTFAGGGAVPYNENNPMGDGRPATEAKLNTPSGLAFGADGTLFISDWRANVIRKVTPSGTIEHVAGVYGSWEGFSGDGGLATKAELSAPKDVAVAPDGTLYIADDDNQRIRRVDGGGIITTVAGKGFSYDCEQQDGGPSAVPDGTSALAGYFCAARSVEVAADGTPVFATYENLYRVHDVFPSLSKGSQLIPSRDGNQVFQLSGAGRHLRTYDGLTGAVTMEFAYNDTGQLTSVTDRKGQATTIQRDAAGRPTAILAPTGQTTHLASDAAGNLASITNPAGEKIAFEYGDNGLMTKMVEPGARVFSFAYDATGRLISDTNPGLGTMTLSRLAVPGGHQVTVTTPDGVGTVYTLERLESGSTRRTMMLASGATTTEVVAPNGDATLTEPSGVVREVTLQPDPRWGMQAPLRKQLTTAYPGGAPPRTTTSTRKVTLQNTANPLAMTTMTDTDTVNGKVLTRTYSGATRTMTLRSAEGRESTQQFDDKGRLVQLAWPQLSPIGFSYDASGRVTSVTQGPRSSTYAFDAKGRIVAKTDDESRTTTYAYDGNDRLTSVTLPGGRKLSFGLTPAGEQQSIQTPGGTLHTFSRDARSQMTAYTPPSGSPYAWTYDADGDTASVTLPGGRTTSYDYDPAGRLSSITSPEAAIALDYAGDTMQVDTATRTPTQGAPAALATAFLGDLPTSVAASGASTGTFSYTYDSAGRLSGINLSSGSDSVPVAITRDGDGFVTGMGPFAFARSGPVGATTSITGGGLTTAVTYDSLAQMSSRQHSVNGSSAYRIDLVYDGIGRVTQKTETIGGTPRTYAYSYDVAGRLIGVTKDAVAVEQYTYDANGNRVGAAYNGGPLQPATFDNRDRLSSLGSNSYTVNGDGFLTQRNSDTFSYGANGELLRATIGGSEITYAYDARGRRVARNEGGTTEQYLYGNPHAPWQVTAVRGADGVLTTLAYDTSGSLFSMLRGGQRYFVATDQVNSPRVVADAAGNVIKTIEYDSFGRVASDSAPGLALPIGFGGGLADTKTGLVNLWLRDYDALSGRFTAPDPLLFAGGSTNLYSYVSNNPVTMVDPVGTEGGAASGASGAPAPASSGPSFGEVVITTIQSAIPTVDAIQSTVSDAVEWVDSIVDGDVVDHAGNKALDGAKDAIAPGALEEQRRILEDVEKTSKESVNPFSSAVKQLWQTCTGALSGESGPSKDESKSSKKSFTSDPDDPGAMRPLTQQQINQSRAQAAQMPGY